MKLIAVNDEAKVTLLRNGFQVKVEYPLKLASKVTEWDFVEVDNKMVR